MIGSKQPKFQRAFLSFTVTALSLISLALINLPGAIAGTSEAKSTETTKTTNTASGSKTTTVSETAKPSAASGTKTTTKTTTGSGATKASTKSTTVKAGEAKTVSTSSGLPKVMDFGAKWCVPCLKFAPTFDKIGATYKGKVEFLHYDVESAEGKPISDKFNVNVMPTIIIVDAKGKTTWRKEGLTTEADLVKNTEAMLKSK